MSSSRRSIVRQSKFRHVFTPTIKPKELYTPARIPGSAWLGSDFCAAGTSHFSLPWGTAGGGAVAVIAYADADKRRLEEKTDLFPIISGHSSPVLDVAQHPFAEELLGSAGQDCYVKVWNVGQGNLNKFQTKEDALWVGQGHGQKVGCLSWHPTAASLLLSAASDGSVCTWDLASVSAESDPAGDAYSKPTLRMNTGYRGDILSAKWNEEGSNIVVAAKDKHIRTGDPRTGEFNIKFKAHPSVKGSRALFLKDGRILSTGYNQSSGRELCVWDPAMPEKPLFKQQLDVASGMLSPFYDSDLDIVYIAGRGESQIRLFEYAGGEDKVLHHLTTHKGTVPYKGGSFVPKRALDISENEIGRFMALCDLKNAVVPVSFRVPRKSNLFQDDIFPPSASGSGEYALMSAEWLAGADGEPIKKPLDELFVQKEVIEEKAEEEEDTTPEGAALQAAYQEAVNRVNYLEVEIHLRNMVLKAAGFEDWVAENALQDGVAAGAATGAGASGGTPRKSGVTEAQVEAARAKSEAASEALETARKAEQEAQDELAALTEASEKAAAAAAEAAKVAKVAAQAAATARRQVNSAKATRERMERAHKAAEKNAETMSNKLAAAAGGNTNAE